MTEKLFTGTLNKNQNKNKKHEQFFGDYTSINEIESGAVKNGKPGAAQEKLFS